MTPTAVQSVLNRYKTKAESRVCLELPCRRSFTTSHTFSEHAWLYCIAQLNSCTNSDKKNTH